MSASTCHYKVSCQQ